MCSLTADFLTLALSPHRVSRGLRTTRKLGGPDPNTLATHTHSTHIPSPCRVHPGTNPQVVRLSAPFWWPAAGTPPPPPATPSARPSAGGSRGGAGPTAEGPSPGAVRGPDGGGRRGWGRGRRAGAGVSLPPSLSPVKSRGAAGLSPVSSSCSLGRAAVTVHRRRRGLHRRVRPPASMATTATCTRFTDDYQLFEELGKYDPPASRRGPPPCPRRPGAMRLLAPPPRPCTGRCSAPSARPTPSLSRPPSPGPPRPQLRTPQPPPRPAAAARAAAHRAAAGTAAPGPLLGALQPRPSLTLQTPPILTPPARRAPSSPCSGAHSALCPMSHAPGTLDPPRPCSSNPAAVPECGGMFGARPRPPLGMLSGSQPRCWAVLQHPLVPSPYPCSGPGSRAPQPQHPPPLCTELAAAAAPAPPPPPAAPSPATAAPALPAPLDVSRARECELPFGGKVVEKIMG